MNQLDPIYSNRGNAIEGSAIRAILAVTQQPGIISFAGGLPNEAVIPVDIIKKIVNEILSDTPYPVLQYSVTEGFPHFRTLLSEMINSRYGTSYTREETLITTGSQQAIDLAADMLINPGDNVLVERPTYLAALQIFRKVGATLVEADCDALGMKIESVEKTLKTRQVKFIYVVPDHQNPSGIEWSLQRREALVAVAKKYSTLIVEDGAYREIRFVGRPLPPIAHFDYSTNRSVLLLQTASKILAPSLRIGWVHGPKELIAKMTLLKQSMDVHTPGLNQEIVYRYFSQGHFDRQLPRIIDLYKARAKQMDEALRTHGKEILEWHTPKGGLFIWAKVKKSVDTAVLLPDIVKKYHVAYVPGATFFAHNPDKRTFRLNFSKPTEEQIEKGIHYLTKALSN